MSDLGVNIDPAELLKLEDTFSYMDELSDNDVSRPDSNISFSSWTFSPIESSDETQSGEIMKEDEADAVAQKLPPLQPMNQQPCYQPISPDSQLIGQPQPMYYHSEPYYPSAVYHHHSVNIHNYNMATPAWNFYRERPLAYSMYNVPQVEYNPEHQDPLASFNSAETEYARCSTPEYIMALNSLEQPDSPPSLQSTAKNLQDCSYAPSLQARTVPVPKHIQLAKQDSGYNSDLDSSPVIDYQDNQVKLSKVNQMRKPPTSTSTPVVFPVFRVANMVNKENVPPVPRRLLSPMTMPGFIPKICANQSSYLGISQTNNQSSFRQIQSQEVTSSMIQNQTSVNAAALRTDKTQRPLPLSFGHSESSGVKYTSMADFQAAKKKASQEKRKAETVVSVSPIDVKRLKLAEREPVVETAVVKPVRRRHNEPLNIVALDVMNEWYLDNLSNPYPSKTEKEELARKGGITVSQVKSWFANKRNRSNNTRPKKQKKVMEEQLMDICHQLARDARKPNKDNAYYIQQLSSLIHDATSSKPQQDDM